MDDAQEYTILSPCTTSKTTEMRTKKKMDLDKAEKELSKDHEISANTSVFLSFPYKGKPFTLFSSGKIVIKGTDPKEGKALLLEVFNILKERGVFIED